MYCHVRGCREIISGTKSGPFCFVHLKDAIEATAMKPVYMRGKGYGSSACYYCGNVIEFRFGLYARHLNHERKVCVGSGQEIALLLAE
jgi:hypothetical protein